MYYSKSKGLALLLILGITPFIAKAATTTYIPSTSTFNNYQTNYATATFRNSVTMPAGSTATFNGSLIVTSTMNVTSSSVTFASGSNTTLNGTMNITSSSTTFSGASTTTFNGAIGFGGVFPSSGSYPVSQAPGFPPKWTSFGRIIQIQNFTFAASSATSVSSFIPTNVTGSITPVSTTSKILVLAQSNIRAQTQTKIAYASIFRNTSNIQDSTNGGVTFFTTTGGDSQTPMFLMFYDSPATTSSTSYTVYIKTDAGGTVNLGTSTASLILVEIQQ